MKKFFICCLSIISIFVCGILVSACNKTNTKSHTHSYSPILCLDQTQHWNECVCGKITQLELHSYGEVESSKFLKTESSQNDRYTYYKSCKCGKASQETFVVDKSNGKYDGQVFKIGFKSNAEIPSIDCLYETPLETVESSLNKTLYGVVTENLYVKLNNVTGIFTTHTNNVWKVSDWAKNMLFTNNLWTYNQDLTVYDGINDSKLFANLNNTTTFMAYKDVSYLFSYNPVIANEQSVIAAFSQNKTLSCKVEVFDEDFNNITCSSNTNASTHTFLSENKCYISVTFATTQTTTLVVTNFSTTAQSISFDNSRLSSIMSMQNNMVYSYRLNVSAAGSKLQIMQTAGEIVVMNSSGTVFNPKIGTTNIYELPTDYYIIFVKCTNGDNNYRLQYSTGKYVSE